MSLWTVNVGPDVQVESNVKKKIRPRFPNSQSDHIKFSVPFFLKKKIRTYEENNVPNLSLRRFSFPSSAAFETQRDLKKKRKDVEPANKVLSVKVQVEHWTGRVRKRNRWKNKTRKKWREKKRGTDRVLAAVGDGDEVESAIAVALVALFDVLDELAADGAERVDAEGRAAGRPARHFVGGGGEDGEQDVVLGRDAQRRRQLRAGLVHVRRLHQRVVDAAVVAALQRHLHTPTNQPETSRRPTQVVPDGT